MRRHALSLALLSSTACGLFNSVDNGINNGVQGATATHLAVITVLETPPIPGIPNSPRAASATIFFGNRPSVTTLQPDPVNGATVTITDTANLSTTAAPVDAGIYVVSSIGGGLTYDPGATYTFTLVDSNHTTYTATGTAPTQEAVSQLQTTFTDDGGVPLPVFTQIAANTAFTLTRSAAQVNGQLDIAFVTVFSIQGQTLSPTFTWTNAPQQPVDFLNLITNDSSWRQPSVTIPAAAFPTAGLYLVALTAVSKGQPTSTDLFTGSAVLLGTATVGVLDAR